MSAQTVYGITRLAATTRLPVPSIRYWAEMYGALIGAERLSHGEWIFGDKAVQFFTMVATEQATAAARNWDPSEPAPSDMVGPDIRADAVTAKLDALTARTEDLSLHIGDLAEETKQLQVLLTRIIALLGPTQTTRPAQMIRPTQPALVARQSTTPQPTKQKVEVKTVRPWHPPRV